MFDNTLSVRCVDTRHDNVLSSWCRYPIDAGPSTATSGPQPPARPAARDLRPVTHLSSGAGAAIAVHRQFNAAVSLPGGSE